MKRVCLFAGFDKKHIICDYVIYYIKELSKFADIYYFFEGDLKNGELSKLAPYVKKSFAYVHGKYDFGSWQELINIIGWDEIEKYSQLILANDSCYAPLFPFSDLFEYMNKKNTNFWGITENKYTEKHHLQSYFLVFDSLVIKSEKFRNFFYHIKKERKRSNIVKNYEYTLTELLETEGFKYEAYMNKNSTKNLVAASPYIELIEEKSPFLKIKLFTYAKFQLTYIPILNIFEFLTNNTNYDTSLIKAHLLHLNCNIYKTELKRVLSNKINKIFREIFRIFGIKF